MLIKELKKEFEAYYSDLKADAKKNGYRVSKVDEWERFKEHHLEDLNCSGKTVTATIFRD